MGNKDLTPEQVEKLKQDIWKKLARASPNIPLITKPEKPNLVQGLMQKRRVLFGLRKFFQR
jgi:hypothetical protein